MIGEMIILVGLFAEVRGIFLISRDSLPISFFHFLREPLYIVLEVIQGKTYPFEYFIGFNAPDSRNLVKGLFFVSGGISLQIFGLLIDAVLRGLSRFAHP